MAGNDILWHRCDHVVTPSSIKYRICTCLVRMKPVYGKCISLCYIAFGAKCNVNVIQNTSKMGRITSKSNSKFRGQVQNVNCITLSSWFA